MPKHAERLNLITIPSPCPANWDSMIGNERLRFCNDCHRNVHNLLEMTPKEVIRLIINSEGRLCARYYQGTDRSVQSAAPTLHQIGRRASRIAAGAFSAVLSLSAHAAARSPSTANQPIPGNFAEASIRQDTKQQEGSDPQGATLVGTVFDATHANFPGARVTIINKSTEHLQSTIADQIGGYIFHGLDAGTYIMKVEFNGFVTRIIEDITLQGHERRHVNPILEVGALGGDVVIVEPSEPLIRAAMNNDLNGVKELLANGVDVNVIDKDYRMTALGMATANGNIEMVQFLLWAGADVDAKDGKGQTALMNLGVRSTAEVAKALLMARAKVDIQDEDGDTALMIVAAEYNLDLLPALLNAGASVHARNEEGQTALMLAARAGLIDNVKTLITAGANVHERDINGWTALKYAQENKNNFVVESLQASGAIE